MIRSSRLRRRTLAAVAGSALLVTAGAPASSGQVRGIPETLCGPNPPASDYLDRDEIASYHLDAVDCLTLLDIARGYGSDQGNQYFPEQSVRRDEMASFVARTLAAADVDLPAASGDPFTDVDDANPHAEAIRQLAEADVVRGVGDGRYAPDAAVPRDQMATFLVRAAALQAGVEHEDLQGGSTPFADVGGGNVHRPSIQGAYELGITNGTGANQYSPDADVSRQQMASFLARALDAMTTRVTVADRDAGALAHTVYTFVTEGGRCFEVKAGSAWVTECDPATNETLQLRRVTVSEGFSVLVGLAAPPVTRVVVEPESGDPIEVELTQVEGGYSAFSSPRLVGDVDAVVAYDSSGEVARETVGDAGLPFPANTLPDTGEGVGPQVVLSDVRVGDHESYERAVFEVGGGGTAGWNARYVDQAVEQGSGRVVDVEGNAILEVSLTNMAYPTDSDVPFFEPQVLDGFDTVTEVHVGSTFEGITQVFVGVTDRQPFRVFGLEDPSRVVLDVVDTSVTG